MSFPYHWEVHVHVHPGTGMLGYRDMYIGNEAYYDQLMAQITGHMHLHVAYNPLRVLSGLKYPRASLEPSTLLQLWHPSWRSAYHLCKILEKGPSWYGTWRTWETSTTNTEAVLRAVFVIFCVFVSRERLQLLSIGAGVRGHLGACYLEYLFFF